MSNSTFFRFVNLTFFPLSIFFSKKPYLFHKSPVTNKHDKHRPSLQVYIIEAYLTEAEASFWHLFGMCI